jgi:hypothetical protein
MKTNHAPAIRKQTRPTAVPTGTDRPRSFTTMTSGLQLINEALSRARMRKPQDTTSEAFRPARQIAMNVRRKQSRLSGDTF